MNRVSLRTLVPWIGLVAILIGYAAFIARVRPIALFGVTQDDSIYFSSAKAIAQGRGYILPSVPGGPPAGNKFPVLYPWMLSWVWRFNPTFPNNINDGVALNVAFGFMYLVFSFALFRYPLKLRDGEALALTAFCAFHSVVLFHSASILSDIPFAALALGSLVLGDPAMRVGGSRGQAVLCGVLAGLSILTRTTGYPVVFGVLAIAAFRKAWRQAAIFGVTTALFFSYFVMERLSAVKAGLPPGWEGFGSTFRQTWLYYTDYTGFRKLSIVNLHIAGTIAFNQFLYLCVHLPGFFLSPVFGRNTLLLFVSTVVLLCLICRGLAHTVELEGWKPIHVALISYVAMVLAWNYPDWDRFLIPFLPLVAASLWLEGKSIATRILTEIRVYRHGRRALIACSAGIALGILALGICWNCATNGDRYRLLELSRTRSELLVEKREAYEWLERNTPEDAKVIAAEDASLYLYSGRQSMGHIAMLPVGMYEPEQLQSDLDHLTDVATDIGATYWLGSSDDSDKQWKGAKPQLAARLSQIESVLPEVFRSSGGSVRVYGLRCLQNPQVESCRSAEHVLFPEGR